MGGGGGAIMENSERRGVIEQIPSIEGEGGGYEYFIKLHVPKYSQKEGKP